MGDLLAAIKKVKDKQAAGCDNIPPLFLNSLGLLVLPELPNGYTFVDSPLNRGQNSPRRVCRDFIDFKRRIHVEIITLIRRGNFNMDSTLRIDKILMSFSHQFFYVVSMSNRRNCFTICFLSIIFEHFVILEHSLS